MPNSRAESRQASQSDVFATLTDVATRSVRQMADLVQASEPLLHAYLGLLRTAATLPVSTMSSSLFSMPTSFMPEMKSTFGCCDIPETSCPPYCVCEIVWDGARGQQLTASIRLTNTRAKPQLFHLKADTFQGPSGDTGAAATLSPASVSLQPGQSATIAVGFAVPDTFVAGDAYRADVKVTGLYEQCVRLTLRVRHAPHCEIQQGEIPTRIRAHRWYDHFQCEELCFEPVRSGRMPGDRQPPTDH